MKNKPLILICIVLSIALGSCSKTPTHILDGGPSFGEIYFLTNNNELIEAHESVLNVPVTEGFIDLEIVSYGLYRIEKLGGDSNISLEKRFSVPASESELFIVESSEQTKRYKQAVRVVYSSNTSSKERSATFRLYSYGGNGHAADITFEQRTEDIVMGIPKGNVTLTKVDAATVAKLYLKNKVATKTEASKAIKNVVTIPDEFGEPAIYAVNFEDGFVWVSATKKLCPILAVVEHGIFSLDESKVGIELIKQEYLQMIRQSEVTDSIRRLWRQYETTEGNSEVRTRTSSEYQDELANLKEFALEEGYKVYRLSDAADNDMPQGIINGFEDIACDAYAGRSFDGSEYDYTQTAYVLERNFEKELQYGPLTSTKWNQTSPYNSLVTGERLLGCVTVATAQYMRFKKQPALYRTSDGTICYWHNMPDNSSNVTLSKFLADLRKRLDINDDGSGSVYDIVSLLNSTFGYNVKIYDYNINRLGYPLSINKVVILRGVTSDEEGHVWICDGLRHQVFGGVEYNLYILDHQKYPNFDYVKIKTELDDTYTTTPYCHMNWGWGGSYDGWYYGSDWNTGNGNYVKERRMIY